MRSLSVVSQQSGDQLAVELIGCDQQFLMVVNELFLNRPIKPFYMGIHLGGSGIGVPVIFVQPSNFFVKMLHELRAVVSKD